MKINLINNYNDSINIDILSTLFNKIKNKKTLSLIITSNEEIKKLNQKYRNIERPTDVLSFPASKYIKNDLGDIFISYDKVLEQAKEFNHSIEREISFLAVHGYLHLLGYDHIEEKASKKMFCKTEKILKIVKLSKGDICKKE